MHKQNKYYASRSPFEGCRAPHELVTLSELAYSSGTSTMMIRQLVQEQLIQPASLEPEPCFDSTIFQRVRKMVRLHRQLGVGVESIGLVLDLLDRIERLERQLQQQAE
jgi:hypothetical protein